MRASEAPRKHLKSQNFLGTYPQTPSHNLYDGPRFFLFALGPSKSSRRSYMALLLPRDTAQVAEGTAMHWRSFVIERPFTGYILDLLHASLILPQRLLIEGRLASTDRNTSNAPGSTVICDSTAASNFEALSPLSCIMLLAASRTATEMMFSAYSSHARTSGSCIALSRVAEFFWNASRAE